MEEAKNVLLKIESQIDFAIKLNLHFQGLETQWYAWLKRFRFHEKRQFMGMPLWQQVWLLVHGH